MDADKFPLLRTDRLILRALNADDAEAIYHYLSDEDVIRYLEGNTDSIQEAQGYVSWCNETYQKGTDIRWGIALKDNTLIGDCGLGHINEPKCPTELGFMLDKRYWGCGYMTEALDAILRYGFNTLKLHRIQAWTHLDNAASARVLQKNRFVYEGLLREYVYIWHKDEYTDVAMYSLLSKDAMLHDAAKDAEQREGMH